MNLHVEVSGSLVLFVTDHDEVGHLFCLVGDDLGPVNTNQQKIFVQSDNDSKKLPNQRWRRKRRAHALLAFFLPVVQQGHLPVLQNLVGKVPRFHLTFWMLQTIGANKPPVVHMPDVKRYEHLAKCFVTQRLASKRDNNTLKCWN